MWDSHEAGQAVVTGVSGALAVNLMNRTAPLADSPAGQAILTGQPALLNGDRREAAGVVLGADIGPLSSCRWMQAERSAAHWGWAGLATAPEFTDSDLDMAASFASHAAVVLELAEARADQITLAQVEDHDRIAAELHDHVIQELFALGMKLQGHVSRGDLVTAEQINGYVGSLDEIIIKIRTSIFGLRQSRSIPGGLHARLLEIVEEHAPQLGFTAGIRFAGSLERTADAALTQDILAVTREALSNCARHAHASAVSISLALEGGLITLDITDNGRGLGRPSPLQRPDQHAPPRRTQRRHPPAHHPQHRRYSPDLDRPRAPEIRAATASGHGTRLSWSAGHLRRVRAVRSLRHGHRPGASGLAGRLVHAGVHGEGVGQVGDGKNPPHLPLRRGQHQVPPGAPGLPAPMRQRCHPAGVDERQGRQIHDDLRGAGRDGRERGRDTRGVYLVKFPVQRDDDVTVVSAGAQISVEHRAASCLSSKAGSRPSG